MSVGCLPKAGLEALLEVLEGGWWFWGLKMGCCCRSRLRAVQRWV